MRSFIEVNPLVQSEKLRKGRLVRLKTFQSNAIKGRKYGSQLDLDY
jgi:hypothetical protein